MVFDFRLLFRLLWKSFFGSRGTLAPLTWRRAGTLLAQLVGFAISETCNWVCFLLDDIFFRGYRKLEVREPVFIVGPPRSGTTLLHRLLSKDETRFTTLKAWEIHLAPSIVQKKFWLAAGALDRALGGRVKQALLAAEARKTAAFAKVHPTSFLEPEEDEPLLLHAGSSLVLSFMFPFYDLLRPLNYFDRELPAAQRTRLMAFYRRCLQRHLYVFGADKQLLSKNPLFTTRVQSLRDTFPGARIMWTVRTPFETVPSTLSLLSLFAQHFHTLSPVGPQTDEVLEILRQNYVHPARVLADCPANQHAPVEYERLAADPGGTVRDLYARLGFPMTAAYDQVLVAESQRSRGHQSQHTYSLAQFGLTREDVLTRFGDVLRQFDFDASQPPG